MSILYQNNDGWLLSHKSYVDDFCKLCCREENKDVAETLKMKAEFFQINTPLLMDSAAAKFVKNSSESVKRKKRSLPNKKSKCEYHEEVMPLIGKTVGSIIAKGRNLGHINSGTVAENEWLENNRIPREAAKAVLSKDFHSLSDGCDFLWFENTKNQTIIKNFWNQDFIIPPNSSFFLTDMKHLHLLTGKTFDLVLLDPPWQNKSLKRKKRYATMDSLDLLDILIQDMTHKGSLVVVWATNNESQLKCIKQVLFPKWNVEHCADWHWLKITQRGNFFIPSDDRSPKKPYENIIIGRVPGSDDSCVIESHKVVVSVPSGIHSHKPPLSDILKPYLPSNPKCLELFARYLLPGWTSVGNEVLKLQSLDIFEKIS